MKKGLKFFETLYIAIFDFKSYLKFVNMPFLSIILNRIAFVFLISVFHVIFLSRDIKSIDDFNKAKYEVFEDISYSNNTLNIKNSPTLFSTEDFILVGDTRENFDLSESQSYSEYRNSLVLLKNSFIIRNGTKKIEIKYSDFYVLNLVSLNGEIGKNEIFEIIDMFTSYFKYAIYIILPISMIINFFIMAFVTSFFAFFCAIITRFKMKFIQVYKMILFAQGTPFLIISIFEIIAKFNGIRFAFPSHILEFFTLLIFLISLFSIRYDAIRKILKK